MEVLIVGSVMGEKRIVGPFLGDDAILYAENEERHEHWEVATLELPVENDAQARWDNNAIQFPRLISEMMAAGNPTKKVWVELKDSMGLESEELHELFDRAHKQWETIKEMAR